MLKVAVCDDDLASCEKLMAAVANYTNEKMGELSCRAFHEGDSLISYMKKGDLFDIVFLSIRMSEENGLDVARKIREELNEQLMQIVYLSEKEYYLKEMFEVHPLHFMKKPLDDKSIIDNLVLAWNLKEKMCGTFSFMQDNQCLEVACKDIVYLEGKNRKVHIVCKNQEFHFMGRIQDIVSKIGSGLFLTIHRSYVVNFLHVTIFQYEKLQLNNGTVLPISQRYRKEIREKVLNMEQEGLER